MTCRNDGVNTRYCIELYDSFLLMLTVLAP
jgi:hypothetical protein